MLLDLQLLLKRYAAAGGEPRYGMHCFVLEAAAA
jgi:hypothetical protein